MPRQWKNSLWGSVAFASGLAVAVIPVRFEHDPLVTGAAYMQAPGATPLTLPRFKLVENALRADPGSSGGSSSNGLGSGGDNSGSGSGKSGSGSENSGSGSGNSGTGSGSSGSSSSGSSSSSGTSSGTSGSQSGSSPRSNAFGGVEQVGPDLSTSQEAEAISSGWK